MLGGRSFRCKTYWTDARSCSESVTTDAINGGSFRLLWQLRKCGMKTDDRSAPAALPEIKIYTDGGCEPNPGLGGYGAVLIHPKKRAEVSGGFRKTTNNRMEIFAAIAGLELLKQPCKVILYSDSEYLVNALTKGWVDSWKRKQWWHSKTERVPNRDLWERLLVACENHQVEFRWV